MSDLVGTRNCWFTQLISYEISATEIVEDDDDEDNKEDEPSLPTRTSLHQLRQVKFLYTSTTKFIEPHH